VEEEYRPDVICARLFGKYNQRCFEALVLLNPMVDFSDLVAGTILKIPRLRELFFGRY